MCQALWSSSSSGVLLWSCRDGASWWFRPEGPHCKPWRETIWRYRTVAICVWFDNGTYIYTYIYIYIAHTDTYVINISYVNCFTTFMYVRCMLMYSCFFLDIMEVSRMGSNLEGLPEVPEHPTWGCHGDNGSCWYGLWSKVDLQGWKMKVNRKKPVEVSWQQKAKGKGSKQRSLNLIVSISLHFNAF